MILNDIRNQISSFTVDPKPRALGIIELVLIHRIDGCGETGLEIAEYFRNVKLGTNGKMPYAFIIRRDGQVDYCVDMAFIAPAALAASKHSIQVAFIGNFTKEPPSLAQHNAGLELCTALCQWLGKVCIEGHTERPGRSKAAHKNCPGKFFNIHDFKAHVKECVRLCSRENLTRLGVTV